MRCYLPSLACSSWLSIAAVGLVGVSCASFDTNLQDSDVKFEETAKANYDSAEKAFSAKRFNEATKFFEHVKNKFPYSKFAVLSELRLADAHFAREKWLEAADAYRIFVRIHPRHESVPYATFRVALAHSNAIEEDSAWLPMVAAREKDQSAARDAVRAFDEFLTRFPTDERAKEAHERRTKARAHLAEADIYAAAFYAQRERWQGALWRYERVASEFADTPKAPWALLQAAQIAGDKLGDKAAAKKLYEQLLREHPKSSEATAAKQALGS